MTKTREPKAGIGSSLTSQRAGSARARSSRLATWPPTFRSKESKPIILRHEPGEVPKMAKPRGWRISRAMFSEFSDD